MVYLDDIVVYSATLEEDKEDLRMVLDKLRENQLYVKKEKCAFGQTSIRFLGHVIEQGRIRMDLDKVKAIQERKVPSPLVLQSFDHSWVWPTTTEALSRSSAIIMYSY